MADIGIDVFHLSIENHKVVLLFFYKLCIILEKLSKERCTFS